MLTEPIEPADAGPDEIRDRYVDALADVLREVGWDNVAKTAEIESDRLDAIEAGDADDVTLADATAVLALDAKTDAEALLAAARETVLLEMSTAVVDVETLAADLDGELSPQEVHAAVEGRLPLSLEQYARIRYRLADDR